MPQTRLETLKGFLTPLTDVPAEKIRPDSHLMKDLHLDGFDRVDFLMDIEAHFGLDLSDDILETHHTLEAFLRLLDKEVPE